MVTGTVAIKGIGENPLKMMPSIQIPQTLKLSRSTHYVNYFDYIAQHQISSSEFDVEELHVTSSMTSPMVAAMLEVFCSRRK
jgi:hypothetical protein